MAENKKDFFISYNGKDKDWAEWIAWQLKEAGHSLVIQDWDFRPGGNFIVEMQKAAQADRTLIVLSPNYLEAEYTQPEWAAAFAQDPTGAKRTLLPVRVAECKPSGLLAPIIYIDLVGLEEAAAREKLLAGIPPGSVWPLISPLFPSGQGQPERPPPRFPESPPAVRKIRNQIRELLKQPGAKSLYDEISLQAGVESAADALVPRHLNSPLEALDLLHKATESCLQKLVDQKPDSIDSIRQIAGAIFGWLVLLAVDRQGCSMLKPLVG
ncbi:MAG: toll/interleukin-1 receptor domain-containing protein [Candidatus Competibacteraceae bacterium]